MNIMQGCEGIHVGMGRKWKLAKSNEDLKFKFYKHLHFFFGILNSKNSHRLLPRDS